MPKGQSNNPYVSPSNVAKVTRNGLVMIAMVFCVLGPMILVVLQWSFRDVYEEMALDLPALTQLFLRPAVVAWPIVLAPFVWMSSDYKNRIFRLAICLFAIMGTFLVSLAFLFAHSLVWRSIWSGMS